MLNGILTLKPTTGNYVTGDVADALGIAAIRYIGVGSSSGSGGGTVQGGDTADNAILGQLGYFLNSTTTINIKSSDGTIIDSQEFYAYASIQDLIAFLRKNGISAEIKNNILELDNDNGIYAEDATTGGLLTQIGVGVTTKAVSTSFLTVITSVSESVNNAVAISAISSLPYEGGVFSISTAEELRKLSNLLASDTGQNCVFLLTNDIDLGGSNFTPLGGRFEGSFYGNGHVIKNLSISSSNTQLGLFQHIDGRGIVQDLGIENVKITYTGSTGGSVRIGGLAGVSEGAISNCFVRGTIEITTGTSAGYAGYIGGLVGEQNDNSITNSYVSGTIIRSTASGTNSSLALGGVVGYLLNGTSISNSLFEGNISFAGGNNVVGLAGSVAGAAISNCYASGSLIGSDSGRNIGMLCGSLTGSVYNSATFGTVSINGTAGKNYIAGFIGSLSGYTTNVSECYSAVDVSASCAGTATYYDYAGVAGFAGVNKGYGQTITISKCYATGNVSGLNSTGNIISAGFAAAGGDGYGQLNIQNCYYSGDITSSGDSTCETYGFSNADSNQNCYMSGKVTGGSTQMGSGCYYNSDENSGFSDGIGISLSAMQNQTTMQGYGFTSANGWSYTAGQTPQLVFDTGKETIDFYSNELLVNTDSDDLQDIIDNGIHIGGDADSGVAIETDTLGNVIAFSDQYMTINIKNTNGVVIASQGFNTYSTIGELIKFLNDNGIEAYMSGGVLYLDNDEGLYAEDAVAGGVLSQMQISTTTKSVTTSFLSVITTVTSSSITPVADVEMLVEGNMYSKTSRLIFSEPMFFSKIALGALPFLKPGILTL